MQKVASVECEVVLAAPRSLTFTTSGKLSRAAAKANYLAGMIQDVASPLGDRVDAARSGNLRCRELTRM